MRTPFVAGNWKMNMTIAGTRDLVAALVPGLQPIDSIDRVICPPFMALMAARALLEGTSIGLGAQNMYWKETGAYTGEVSPTMVAELCQFVILGHSERRAYFGETDAGVNRKLKSALAHGLTPIVCVGETLEQNEAGKTAEVVSRQIRVGLAGLEAGENGSGYPDVVVAYEPVWAIGTGRAATPAGANEVIRDVIRASMADLYDETFAQGVRVLYGGSVKPGNAGEFFSQPDIDGALVGGASLRAADFIEIARVAAL